MSASTHAVPARQTRVDPPIRSAQAQASQLDAYLQVLNALLLRDMRSRFFGSYWGYLVQMLWPVAHVILLVAIMMWRDLDPPMGDSALLFVATGAFPFLGFKYMSREIMKGQSIHKSLTWFPQVKRVDTMVARALVEVVSSFMGLGVICVFLLSFGVNPVPVDLTTAITGYMAAIAMGMSVGVFNHALVAIFPFWMLMYIVVAILLYLSSGVMFMACYLPEQLYSIMKWNPMVQIVEWVRLGYDPNLPVSVDYLYVVGWIFSALTIGFLMDRYLVTQ